MNKIKIILLSIIFVLFFVPNVYSDNYQVDMFDKLQIKKEDVNNLNERIFNLIKKDDSLSKIQGLKLFHIFNLESKNKIKKNEFIDYSFLDKLRLSYYTILYRETNIPIIKYLFKIKQKYFIDAAETLIVDSTGTLVGTVSKYWNYIYRNTDSSRPSFPKPMLAKMFFNNEINFAFHIYGDIMRNYFIKKNRVYTFKRYMTDCEELEYEVVPLEEFMKCCYDKLIWGR
jgi:hypothetical protein